MGFFSRKREVDLEQFSRDFYETQILTPLEGRIDGNALYADVVKKSVAEVYPEFANINSDKIRREFIALRFELFALAWAHKFGDDLAVLQSRFTKRFLHEKNYDDIWNDMEIYHKAISRYALAGLGKLTQATMLRTRADLADKYIARAEKEGLKPDDSIGRPVNRMNSEWAWESKAILGGLVLAFCEKLGIDPNKPGEEAGFRMGVAIKGFYDGAYQALAEIKVKS